MSRLKLRSSTGVLLSSLLIVGSAIGQPAPKGPPGGVDRRRPGPWDNDVSVYRLRSGQTPEKIATFHRAGVPTVARLQDGRLLAAFQHFPQDDNRNFDRIAVRFSKDEGRSWSPAEPIAVDDLEPGLARPFDPTLAPLPDGRIRLYFTSSRSPDFKRSLPAIYSAISADGIHYSFEPGVRFAVEGRIVIDCAVAVHQGTFHLIVPNNGSADEFGEGQGHSQPPPGADGYHAVSQDGLRFERVADVKLASRQNRWLGNMQSDDGKLFFFGTGPGAWPMVSTDGASWRSGGDLRFPGADPGVVKLKDGSWLVLGTSPPRPGTPSDLRRRPY